MLVVRDRQTVVAHGQEQQVEGVGRVRITDLTALEFASDLEFIQS